MQNAVNTGNVFFSGETIMRCVLNHTDKKDDPISWCNKKMIGNNWGFNYSFIASLKSCNKNDVCKDCSMAIIRKLLYVMDKEDLILLI